MDTRKQKSREASARYRAKNKDKLNAAERERRENDPEWAEKRRERVRQYHRDNHETLHPKKVQWAKENPESVLATKRKGKLGISRADQEALFASQNAQCAICGDEITFVKGHLDHCHKTGKVRGFLCHWCNHIIGNAKDETVRLEAAILYLRQWQGSDQTELK